MLEKIGNVKLSMPVILAPMAGVTDFPFRHIVRSFGAGLSYTEMIASRAIIESFRSEAVRKRLRFFDKTREDQTVGVQLVGFDPKDMAEAARFNESIGADIIDINMGCPVKKVVNTDSGAALMKNEKLAEQIISSVVNAVKVPVTVKMRLGWDSNNLNAKTIALIAQDCGACAVSVHARTRSQFYSGNADWEALKAIKDAIKIPLIGNGDIRTAEEAKKMLEESGADAIMIGRGACGNPWILNSINSLLNKKTDEPKIDDSIKRETIKKHIGLIIEEYGEYTGVLFSRKHLGWYSKSMIGGNKFREAVNKTSSSVGLMKIIDEFFV